ncbi:hypothetical protein GT348_05855 [Aristophania vespae]|uniref:Uncharacterized protein n=1 Tax=Aristophania vespae TaxID=2697033 RepID=A0A6P1NJH7_9PROT|nr:hypothetical protein [Aristophania vespae]QHI95832.1 hypothetical protein GT348_05855 [Aristophania vespae]UMM63548.1 hypothetical protein DM15PD_05220 [Aristophania vespae]
MSIGFALCFVFIFLSLGRDAKWLAFYGLACAFTVSVIGNGPVTLVSFLLLLSLNFFAWLFLRQFTEEERKESHILASVLPVALTIILLLILALAGSNLGLVMILALGLTVASLCIVASGGALVQFCGLLMAADGLFVVACVFSSWTLFFTALALWGVMALLGGVLLPRLAWRKVEER